MTDYKSIIESPFYEKANKYVEETGNNDCTLEAYIDGATEATKELEAQIEKMKCCGNCKHYQFQNDARCYTCTKDGKRNGKNYRSCEFLNLEKWELREIKEK